MKITSWKMDFLDYKGISCTIPTDMYSVLFENGYISDPYYGTNEEKLTPLSENDVTFYSEFSLDKKSLESRYKYLTFYGIDTICDIYLNGTPLDSVKNMHRKYEYEVGALLKEKNEIRLLIKSPIKYFEKMEKEHHLYTNGDTISGAAHLRKSLYMSGWDWAPALPNMGIFRDVELSLYDTDKIEETEIIQRHEKGKVTLNLFAKAKHNHQNTKIEFLIDGKKATLENGEGQAIIDNPRLWWPNGYGKQELYDISFNLYENDILVDTKKQKIGLRTIELSQEKDEDGEEFCFKVNGIKIFAMGANYVPIESLISRATKETTERLIKDCIFANFNSIRVWGGAYYPEDYFYDLCDKYGLIVWQDFMVACANIWLTDEMEKELKDEARYNLKRIRHHASLGLLCGNNEMEEAICNWEDADGNDPEVRRDYLKLYEDILPKIRYELAPYIPYIPSSPTSGGGFDDPQNKSRGDVHFWDVWNGNCEFDEYRRHKLRFCSEYGFESLPNIKTIRAFCPREEENLLSYTMEAHQKHWHGNVKILKYLAEAYQMPKDMELTVYASQLNQANAIKYGVEHFRRNRGYTMGSIYWQLNDPWPVASWSSVDYYGRYKALHYFAKRFYAPVNIGLFNEGDKITINIANEMLTPFEGYIVYGAKKADLTPLFEEKASVKIEPLYSLDVKELSNSSFNSKNDAFFYVELYDNNGSLVSRNTELGKKPKHFNFLKPEIKIDAKATQGGVFLTFTASALAKDLEVSFKNYDLYLSDNYFDLIGKPYTVFVKTELPINELLSELKLISVYDIPLRY